MQALKFNLYGKSAFFKKPDVNTYLYFTYSHVHKVALMGIFGAICGFEGYNKQQEALFPQFYEKLKNIEIAIVPKEGCFSKKVQTFNNSVGYASTHTGGNLVVREQWLENPSWNIYIKHENDEINQNLCDRLLNSRFVYLPYLGKNDHFANIKDVEMVEIEKLDYTQKIDSLILKKTVDEITLFSEEDFDEDDENYYKYEEYLPLGLDEFLNQYVLEKFVFTNGFLKISDYENTYKANGQNIQFF